MEKGTRKDWTPESEEIFIYFLNRCTTSAERQLITVIRDLAKYDQRTRAGKRARAKSQLYLFNCSDNDLIELAKLESLLLGCPVEDKLAQLRLAQSYIKEKGIKRSAPERR